MCEKRRKFGEWNQFVADGGVSVLGGGGREGSRGSGCVKYCSGGGRVVSECGVLVAVEMKMKGGMLRWW